MPGLPPEKVLGQGIYTIILPDSHRAARACIAEVRRTGQPSHYLSLAPGPHGQTHRYENRVVPLPGDSDGDVCILSTDITRAPPTTADATGPDRGSPSATVAWFTWPLGDDTAPPSVPDPHLRAILGTERVVDAEAYLLGHVHPLDLEATRKVIEAAIHGDALRGHVHRVVHADRSVRWVRLRVARGATTRGKRYLRGSLEDLSPRVRPSAATDASPSPRPVVFQLVAHVATEQLASSLQVLLSELTTLSDGSMTAGDQEAALTDCLAATRRAVHSLQPLADLRLGDAELEGVPLYGLLRALEVSFPPPPQSPRLVFTPVARGLTLAGPALPIFQALHDLLTVIRSLACQGVALVSVWPHGDQWTVAVVTKNLWDVRPTALDDALARCHHALQGTQMRVVVDPTPDDTRPGAT